MPEDLFTYIDYQIAEDRQSVYFNFSIAHNGQTYELQESIKFPKPLPENKPIESNLKALHLALGISYYKIFVSNSIQHPYTINQEEADFWNEVFKNGLGEFLYVNKLDKNRLAKFYPQSGISTEVDPSWEPEKKGLLGIGGGKDSIVAGELLKEARLPITGFVLATGEQLGQTKQVADVMDIELDAVERNIDKQLLEIQELPGAYKGHIPISLIFGLIGGVLAITDKASFVVVANESSASIPRIEWQGELVNHQWSKSIEFETMLQNYLHSFVSPKLNYLSAIRPYGSIGIAKIFANYSQYFEVFTSDNSIFRINKDHRPEGRWSLESPKSLSSFILLSPWLTEEELLRTFGRNFLDETSLEKLFFELIGIEGHQPLDCVGTEEELLASLNRAYEQGKFKDSSLVKAAIERGAIKEGDWAHKVSYLSVPRKEDTLPILYDELINLFNVIALGSNFIIAKLENKDIVFVGAGQGRALNGVEEFLRKNININSFTAVDKKDSSNPLDFLKDYNQYDTVFIKNEAIPGSEMPVPYITPMQLFFEYASRNKLQTIGITGTKGKSTTSALTAHILKTAGKNTILAGNIGVSPLLALSGFDPKSLDTYDTFFVLELSSYQLSDLKQSPHISVCINLFNDHSDWHGSQESYWEAKRNIVRFSKPSDFFVYNPDFAELDKWANESEAFSVPIDPNEPFDLSGSELYGDHNRLNVLVAKEIAELFGRVDKETVVQAVKSFHALDHRMQFVATKNDVTYIDDAIGMTPESTVASIKAVSDRYGSISCLMLGGQDRDYDFKELIDLVTKLAIPNLVLFPDTADKILENLPSEYKPNTLKTSDMKEAVSFASKNASRDTVVLLSTAAPSYSVWKNFEDKGDQFQQAVKIFPSL